MKKGITVAQVDDVFAERSGARAWVLAERAADELRAGSIPDLTKLAKLVPR